MTLYVYDAGSKLNATPHDGTDVATNPLIVNTDATANVGVVCYEIRNDNSIPTSAGTFTHGSSIYPGVSYSASFDVLNREYPDNTTNGSAGATDETSFLNNLSTTAGYKIHCATYDINGILVEGTRFQGDITTNDYFVVLFADDHLKHHVAKITEILSDDITGDGFEFSPKYSKEIPVGTKFAIYKGPLVSDTSVVAVAYGLESNIGTLTSDSDVEDGTGHVNDVRHGGITYGARPLFYFYNDRLDKPNELNHNTKYKIHYSKYDSGVSAPNDKLHDVKCFMTQVDYSLKVMDYSPYTMNIEMTDMNRYNDGIHLYSPASGVTHDYSSTKNFRNWNNCLLNCRRSNKDIVAYSSADSESTASDFVLTNSDATVTCGSNGNIYVGMFVTAPISGFPANATVASINTGTEGSNVTSFELSAIYTGSTLSGQTLTFTTNNKVGPTKYLHYDDARETLNYIPEVTDLNIYDSINKSGSYADLQLVDQRRIYGTKVNDNDPIIIRKTIGDGIIGDQYNAKLPGLVYCTAGSPNTTLTFKGLSKNQNLNLLLTTTESSVLKSSIILLGNYYYEIDTVGGWPTFVTGSTTGMQQTVEIKRSRHIDETDWNYLDFYVRETFSGEPAYRRHWCDLTETLMVNWKIDTTVNHAFPFKGTDGTSPTFYYLGNEISSNDSRLSKHSILLTGSKLNGYKFDIDWGDYDNNFVKLKNPRQQLFQDETTEENSNILDYYLGGYILEKEVFNGSVENFEDFTEDGAFKYRMAGRGKISKLLGPIINRNYTHSKDMIYSTLGPILENVNTASIVTHSSNTNSIGASQILLNAAPTNVSVGDYLFRYTGEFIGQISAINTSPHSFTLTESSLSQTNLSENLQIAKPNMLSFSKAMSVNTNTPNKATSLYGTAEKGLLFTGGKKLKNMYSTSAALEGVDLSGTSANSHSNAIGYHIRSPQSIRQGEDSFNKWKNGSGEGTGSVINIDYPFYCYLGDETDTFELTPIDTVNCLTEYSVVSIVEDDEGGSTISLAPNMPTVLGRIDSNYYDTTGEVLNEHLSIICASTHNKGYVGSILVHVPFDPHSGTASDQVRVNEFFDLKDKHLYNNNKQYLGKVMGVSAPEGCKVGGAHKECFIILDRPLEHGVANTDKFYIISGTVNSLKATARNHGLYLLNTQGLKSGGTLQLLNPSLSSGKRPVIFNAPRSNDSIQNYTVASDASISSLSDQFGSFSWRYFNLQKGTPGAIYYRKFKLKDGTKSDLYSHKTGNFSAYANSIRYEPMKSGPVRHSYMGQDNYYDDDQYKQGSPETRGIKPAEGSAFSDWNIFSDEQIVNYDYIRIPQSNNSNGGGGNWDDSVSSNTLTTLKNSKINGFTNNPVTIAKDNFEIIDPKVTRTFLFGNCDLYPDSMRRKNHIGNISRDFSGYNITIRSKPMLTASNIQHENYAGSLSYLEEKDSNYQTLSISSSNINSNEMKRFGLMRLTEVTYDWHFNEVDPENPPPKSNIVEPFYYTLYQKLTAINTSTLHIDAYGTGSDSKKLTMSDASTPALNYSAGDGIYSSDGQLIGIVDSISGATITCTEDPFYVNGKQHINLQIAKISKNPLTSKTRATYDYKISGRGGKEIATGKAFDGTTFSGDKLGLHMLQGLIFNGQLKTQGYGNYDSNSNIWFQNYAAMYLSATNDENMSALSKSYLMHFIIPPIFDGALEGNNLSVTTAGGAATHVDYYDTSFIVNLDRDVVTGSGGSNKNLKANDRLYNVNGQFLAKVVSIGGSPGDSAPTTINTTNFRMGHPAGIVMTIGNKTNTDSYNVRKVGVESEYTADGRFGGGGHVGGRKEDISLYESAVNDYIHPSRVIQELSRSNAVDRSDSGVYSSLWDGNAYEDFVQEFDHTNPSEPNWPNISPASLMSSANETIVNTGGTLYDYKRLVFLDRFGIEGADRETEVGMSTLIGYDGHPTIQMQGRNLTENCLQTLYAIRTLQRFSEQYVKDNGTYATYNPGDSNDGVSGDGVYAVFKGYLTTYTTAITSHTYSKSVNNNDDICTIEINNPRSNAAYKNYNNFLDYCPNLTGCYLVSDEAKSFKKQGSSYNITTAKESIHNHVPKKIHYIISHTVVEKGNANRHSIVIDNCPSGTLDTNGYRIMRPNQVCITEAMGQEIDLYKMSSNYTLMPNKNEVYGDIGSFEISGAVENDHLKSHMDHNEAIQSMFVIINNDHAYRTGDILPNGTTVTSTVGNATSKHLIPRGVNYDHIDGFIRDNANESIFNVQDSYKMLINDGNTKQNAVITFNNSDRIGASLLLSEPIKKKIGAVSFGEIFTINTSEEIEIKNVESATIGTSVTICSEVESIVNDLLEENNIIYTQDTDASGKKIEYPYFTNPDIKGADLYNTIDYLLSFKNKQIIFEGNDVKTTKLTNQNRYTDIHLNYKNTKIKIAELSRAKSVFDFYNHVTVYGKKHKSIRRNSKSVKNIGKKALEDFNENLVTQEDVDRRAQLLLSQHSEQEKRVTIKVADKGLELLKAGDIITMDFKRDHIPVDDYMVIQIRQLGTGFMELEIGKYRMGLENRLAELLMDGKRVNSLLRTKSFPSNPIIEQHSETLKIKPLKLTAYKILATGSQLGFNTNMNFVNLMGFGTTSTTKILEEDLT